MTASFILAQIFGILGIIASVISMQFRDRRTIFIALFCLNLFSALNFIFLGQFSGAYISLFALVEMIVNSLFERKSRKIPIPLIIFYIIANILIGALTFHGLIDILPIICALIFCLTLLTRSEQNIRKEMFLNQFVWLAYDLSVGAYTFAISNVLTIISTSIAYFRYRNQKKGPHAKNQKTHKRR